MARSTGRAKAKDTGDGDRFFRLPWVVIDSPGWRQAGHVARSLLVDVARQYNGNNNGRLTATSAYLATLGWRSADVIVRARRELLDCGLLIETRKGKRPNVSAWYALTWQRLDQVVGVEIDPKRFSRGEYMRPQAAKKTALPVPPDGIEETSIVPPDGIGEAVPIP